MYNKQAGYLGGRESLYSLLAWVHPQVTDAG